MLIQRQAIILRHWQDAPIWCYSTTEKDKAGARERVLLTPCIFLFLWRKLEQEVLNPTNFQTSTNNGPPWTAEASWDGQLVKNTSWQRTPRKPEKNAEHEEMFAKASAETSYPETYSGQKTFFLNYITTSYSLPTWHLDQEILNHLVGI